MSGFLAQTDLQSLKEGGDHIFVQKPDNELKNIKPDQNQRDLADLKKYVTETEFTPKFRKDGKVIMTSHPSWRAQLAKKGLLVRQTLGSGTYSKVKVARNIVNKKISAEYVAVKIVDRVKAPDDYLKVFLPREVKIWPTLHHKNIVTLHSLFCDSRKIFMVMEYAKRGDVLTYVQKCGFVQESNAREWMAQVCGAVAYMHSRDITHRDLKLENILIMADGSVCLGDFGFVKSRSSFHLSETFCGSKSYAAPEILQGKPYDPKKADTWALGVVLYIMLTGKMPFDEKRGTESILKEQAALRLYWPKILTQQAKDLVFFIFTYMFITRPDIEQIMSHHWFSQGVLKGAKSDHTFDRRMTQRQGYGSATSQVRPGGIPTSKA